MKKLLIFIFILLSSLLIFNLYFFSSKKCYFDFECQWKIVNCCPEQAGAEWKCVNIKNFTEPKCPDFIFCPQVYSPKPEIKCSCINGVCKSA